MELKQQVVSFELAKKMKELGFEQESYFVHALSKNEPEIFNYIWIHDRIVGGYYSSQESSHRIYNPEDFDIYPAYTVAELGEMLPKQILTKEEYIYLGSAKEDSMWVVSYDRNGGIEHHNEFGDTEADARAKMLIYLKENNLLK